MIDYDAAFLTLRPIQFSTGPNFWSVDIGGGSLNAPTIGELLALLRGVIAAENESVVAGGRK